MNELGKLPPQAVDIERAILGALLIEGDKFSLAKQYISSKTFYKDAHQMIFQAMEEVSNIDVLTISEKLRSKEELEEIGGSIYLAELTMVVSSSIHLELHCKVIAEKYMRREIIMLACKLEAAMYDENNDLIDEISDFDKIKNNVISFIGKDEKHISEAINETIQHSIKLNRKEVNTGLLTGFKYYDEFSGGIQNGDLVIIGGETSNGKTTLALNIASNMARKGTRVGIISYEMTIFQLTSRLIGYDAKCSSKDIIRGNIESSKLIEMGMESKLNDSELYMLKPVSSNFDRLIIEINRLVKLYKLEAIFIDYLQLLSNFRKGASTADMFAEMANALKSLSVKLDISTILLSQLARDRAKPRPSMSRLKGSGDIENAADVVMFTYLPYKYGYMTEKVNGENEEIGKNAIIMVAKGRNIGTTEFILRFDETIPAYFNYHKEDAWIEEFREQQTPFDE